MHQDEKEESKDIKWETLRHSGVLFPPDYQRLPSDVKLLYEGQPVDLSPDQEEIAGFWAVMKDTDYVKKKTFIDNFWDGFKQVGQPGPVSCHMQCATP